MKISLNWLKRYIDINASTEELEHVFPMLGLEVESVECLGLPPLENIVVGEVLKKEKHPEADRLSVCEVAIDKSGATEQIVCGASNFKVGDRVPVALVGARLPGDLKIKKTKLRGVPSSGMMCSATELGLGEDAKGLMILEGNPEIGTPINDIFNDSDYVFDLEVTANRGDCLSYLGVARELAAWYNLPIKQPEVKTNLPTATAPAADSLLKKLSLDTENCPYYTAISIKGVSIAPSPEWLQKAITAIGLRPINNVVDITNWVMMESGQPLHAFDANKINGSEIIIRQAKDKEIITTLDSKKHTLDASMMVIADTEKPLVIAGVMGSLDAEVDETTTDIVLESAYFEPVSVRKTARKLNISTDSSYRFARNIDPQHTLQASLRAVDMILEIAGGKLSGPIVVLGKPTREANLIEVSPDFIRAKCGFDITDEAISSIFKRLGYTVDQSDKSLWTVTVPSYRPEVYRPIDLVEEFLRIHGTVNIPEGKPQFQALARNDDRIDRFTSEARNYLAAKSFSECYNYIFRDKADLQTWFGEKQAQGLALGNPLTSDHTHLRPSLIPGLCEALKHNQDHNNIADNLFEIGHVFRFIDGKLWELLSIGFVTRVNSEERRWRATEKPDFFLAKRVLMDLISLAAIPEKMIALKPLSRELMWQDNHSATGNDILQDGFRMTLGHVNLKLIKDLKLDSPVLACELLIKPELFDKSGQPKVFKAFSPYPSSNKDISVIVDATTLADDVQSTIEKIAKQAVSGAFTVEEVSLFDHYQGKGIPEGKKSLAFNLRYRAFDRTLGEQEVAQAFDRLQDKLKAESEYIIRTQ